MAERAAERIAGAEPAQDLDRRGRNNRFAVGVGEQHAAGAELDDRQLDAALEQPPRSLPRVGGADRDLAFLAIADRDRHVAIAAPIVSVASSRERQKLGR